MDRKEIDALLRLMRRHGVAEFTYEQEADETMLHVRFAIAGDVGPGIPLAAPTAAAAAPAAPAAVPASPASGAAANSRVIRSPIVGTFYRAPSPDADPYVKVGDTVRKGQVVCIVEAMKLMNQVESDLDGVVVEILGENGKPVQFGQELFRLAPA